VVAYDPAAAEKIDAPPYRYHYLPERATRPGARKDPRPPPEGIHRPHAPCPFDGEDFVREREVFLAHRSGREYHLVCNRYPVTPHHHLAVRTAAAPPSTLPQRIHAPGEIEDLLLFLVMLGKPYRFYFNSNRGADGSQSGSSVNHWHYQLFPYSPGAPSPLLAMPPARLRDEGPLTIGRIAGWPATHLFLDGGTDGIEAAARLIWRWLQPIHDRNAAYNVQAIALAGGRFRAFLFPRRPAPDAAVPGAGTLSADFGGWECTGDIVIPSREILEWVRARPEEARRLTEKRLRETTREVEDPAVP
jgi:hypothetical protein